MGAFTCAVLIVAILLIIAYVHRRTEEKCRIAMIMMRLWHDHVARTRDYLRSNTLCGATQEKAAAAAADLDYLLSNQDEIGAYFGKLRNSPQDGAKLAQLLREHIVIAGDIVAAAKAGGDISKLSDDWGINADKIADFISRGKREAEMMRKMMREHLKLTAASLNLQLAGKWKEDSQNFTNIANQAIHMGAHMAGWRS